MEYKDGDKIRIWLEDTVEPDGGSWCYGKIEEIKITNQNLLSTIKRRCTLFLRNK